MSFKQFLSEDTSDDFVPAAVKHKGKIPVKIEEANSIKENMYLGKNSHPHVIYSSREKAEKEALAMRKHADPGDEYRVEVLPNGKAIIKYYSDGEFVGNL